MLPGYTNVKSFEMTLNSKYRTEKLKTKNKRYSNTKNQNPERLKLSFSKRIGRRNRRFSDVFRGYKNGPLVENGLITDLRPSGKKFT